MIEAPRYSGGLPWVVHLARVVKVTAAQFRKVCRDNPDWRFELTAEGDLLIVPPTGGETGARSARVTAQLILYSKIFVCALTPTVAGSFWNRHIAS